MDKEFYKVLADNPEQRKIDQLRMVTKTYVESFNLGNLSTKQRLTAVLIHALVSNQTVCMIRAIKPHEMKECLEYLNDSDLSFNKINNSSLNIILT